jgi:hypothetical protein
MPILTQHVDKEGLRKVAERFMKRQEVLDMGLKLEDVEKVLLEHAKKHGGCVNCVYSSPYHGRFSWTSRHCVLALEQTNCIMHRPIIRIDRISITSGIEKKE